MKYAKMKNKFLSNGQQKAAKRVKAIRKTSQPKLKRKPKDEDDDDGWYGSEDYASEEESSYYYTDGTEY